MKICIKCFKELQFITRTTAKDQKKLYRCIFCGYEEIVYTKNWKKIFSVI